MCGQFRNDWSITIWEGAFKKRPIWNDRFYEATKLRQCSTGTITRTNKNGPSKLYIFITRVITPKRLAFFCFVLFSLLPPNVLLSLLRLICSRPQQQLIWADKRNVRAKLPGRSSTGPAQISFGIRPRIQSELALIIYIFDLTTSSPQHFFFTYYVATDARG